MHIMQETQSSSHKHYMVTKAANDKKISCYYKWYFRLMHVAIQNYLNKNGDRKSNSQRMWKRFNQSTANPNE